VAEPAALVAGYEQLRERVRSGRPDGWRLGHGVLAGRGMVAWITAWAAIAPAPAPGTPAPDPSSSSATRTPSTSTSGPPTAALSSLPGAGQIVAVLTQMALAHA
jgi:hypothetical protein